MQKPTYNDLNTWLEHAIQERDHLSVKVDTLQDDLEKARKALDVAVEKAKALKELADIAGFSMFSAGCQDIIEQITALEQKDE